MEKHSLEGNLEVLPWFNARILKEQGLTNPALSNQTTKAHTLCGQQAPSAFISK